MTGASPVRHHPARELLARYAAVFRAAWQARHELAGPRRLAAEAAFLPAALSLQETPVHPAPRRAMALIIVVAALAAAWSWIGQVDIVAVAPGRIVVSERTKVVQPLEAGVVRAIHVRDGDRVRAGQVLVELDPTSAAADSASVREQSRASAADAARARAMLAVLGQGTDVPADPPRGDDQLRAEWRDIVARLGRFDAEATRRQAEAATVQAQIAKAQATLPLARSREADVTALAAQGFAPGHTALERKRERIELERDLATLQARLAETEAARAESRQARAAFVAELRRMLEDRLAKATLDAAQLRQQDAKSVHREQQMRLAAPVDGTVQQLVVPGPGGVVTTAQVLMVVVPEGAEITAEVVLENKDIGFVHVGQVAAVKLETFPFTRYGTVPAVVQRVSADAVVDDKRGAIFPATLALQRADLQVDGRRIALAPGMTLTAEIHTGRRRIADYLLAPVISALDQSLRER